MSNSERLLDQLRPTAFAIAYQMLGSVSEAEDVVQEALLRVHQALDGSAQIASPRAYMATVTTRLAINELRSARVRRERYFGEWLPEPIITGATGGVGRIAVQLAHASGAHTTALVRDAAATQALLRSLGARDAVEQIAGDFDMILDTAGGATFGHAIEHVALDALLHRRIGGKAVLHVD
jgi:RNA polymerase sigma factor (sigma-70 family)